MIRKERLDILLAERGLCPSREQAQRHVLAGEVWNGQTRMEKPGMKIPWELALEVRPRRPLYVSRGGTKLAHALTHFGVDVQDRVCLDVGSSTGGFTDCLLQKGAHRVFAVDVGTGQLDQKLRGDARVTSMEQVNVRHLTRTQLVEAHPDADRIDFICADVSFISLRLLVPALIHSAPHARDWLLLFKPQFEVGPENIGKGGRVRNPAATPAALETFHQFMQAHGLQEKSAPEISPVLGKRSGNTEILLHYEKR